MSPLITENKIEQLLGFLEDLQKFEKISYEEFLQDKHYLVERLLELMVICASDILLNFLSQQKEDMPTTLKTTFLRAGELQVLPAALAQRLADAAGMRNLLVHAYARVDLKVVYESIGQALKDFSEFVTIMSQKIDLIRPESHESPSDSL
jgi:uncharacterized protein YutE (UPF0331/DUF86 family)